MHNITLQLFLLEKEVPFVLELLAFGIVFECTTHPRLMLSLSLSLSHSKLYMHPVGVAHIITSLRPKLQ